MDYQSNSRKSQEKKDTKEKKVEKVVSGEVIKKPKSNSKKFKDIFFGGDFNGVMRYLAGDVLLPALRNMIVDASTKGIERLIYGESYSRRRPPDFRSRVQYHNPLVRREDPRTRAYLPDQPPYPFRPNKQQVDQIIIASREEAEVVLERLADIISTYEVASLADLNELLGLPSAHVDNKWGWMHINGASVRQVRDGYLIELPPMEPL